ncbi:MAG TPA: DUF2258 domain-containing protein [Chromatiaceae bacterium]|nr:DUF2258 domain-containing protein [Chromatiaceae bacterium]
MPQLSTGLVIAGAYADKVRRTLFAQLRDRVKSGELEGREVARAAGELNRLLYALLVDRLGLDKGDVVRVRIEYEVSEGRIRWNYESLTVEAFRRLPSDTVAKALEGVVAQAKEIVEAAVEFAVERLRETVLGDLVYAIKLGGNLVGSFIATPLDESVLIRGAVISPTPVVMKRYVTKLREGASIDELVTEVVRGLMQLGEHVERGEAERVFRSVTAIAEAEEGVRVTEEEGE